MAKRAMLGKKVRRLRRDHGLSQVALARRLGISASYLNLIEHNERPLTVNLLLKLAEKFDIDLHDLSQDEDTRLLSELMELFGDPIMANNKVGEETLRELVDLAPAACQVFLQLYQAYCRARDDVQSLSERLSAGSFLSTSAYELRTLLTSIRSFSEILYDHQDMEAEKRQQFVAIVARESQRLSSVVDEMLRYTTEERLSELGQQALPGEEVSDFVQSAENYFPGLEEAAEEFRRDNKVVTAAIDCEGLAGTLLRLGVRVSSVDQGSGAGNQSLDGEDAALLLPNSLPRSSRYFRMLKKIAPKLFPTALAAPLETVEFAAPASADLALDVLSGYFAAAVMMPYDEMHNAARAMRYDVEKLQAHFATSFEQTCQRLASLQRPSARGIPLHFLRVDVAGNISKRFSASRLPIARYGGVCPRMNVHLAFLRAGQIDVQQAIMPDGSRYLTLARSIAKVGADYHVPKSHFAIGLGCDIAYAAETVYGDGWDLENDMAAVPIGLTCRLCDRSDCRQRAMPAVMGQLQSPRKHDADRAAQRSHH